MVLLKLPFPLSSQMTGGIDMKPNKTYRPANASKADTSSMVPGKTFLQVGRMPIVTVAVSTFEDVSVERWHAV